MNHLFPLCMTALALSSVLAVRGVSAAVTLGSPGGRVEVTLDRDAGGSLHYTVRHGGRTVVEPSPLGLTVGGAEIGGAEAVGAGAPLPARLEGRRIAERFASRGVKSQGALECLEYVLPLAQDPAGRGARLELRVSDDALAFRYVLPSDRPDRPDRTRHVDREASAFTLPPGSRVWYFERDNAWKLQSHAGVWISADIDAMPTVSKQGPVQGCPLVVELPQAGYLLVSEAALYDYSGLRLRAVGGRRFVADYTEADAGFDVAGPVVTPWRVVILSDDLDGLVNSDVIPALNPAPDPQLFADTSYIRPGRCAWRWFSEGTGTPRQEMESIDLARRLGFEYTLIDDGWEKWPDKWQAMARVCAHGRQAGIGVLAWKHYRDVSDPADDYRQLQSFLDELRQAGAAGIKLDFMNGEAKHHIDFDIAALRHAARRRLLVNFHGCQKSSGEWRSYPNELTREGVRGLELNRMKEGPIPASHNAALPFTRFAVGHADYTPLSYTRPGGTSYAHQLATVVLFTSPLQIIAEHPRVLLERADVRPALELTKSIPATWDETRVLPPSKIGEAAVMARRTGQIWYIAALNGDAPVQAELGLSFLDPTKRYACTILRSPTATTFDRTSREGLTSQDKLPLRLAAADGLVARLEPAP